MGWYQLDKRCGLFWIYDVGYGALRRQPAASFGVPGGSRKKYQFLPDASGRSDLLHKQRRNDQPCSTLYRWRARVPCVECKRRYQDFYLELPYPGKDRQRIGRLIPWKVNKNYLKESREKTQLFPALFFLFHRKLRPMKQKTLRENAHLREAETCRKRPRETPGCAKAHPCLYKKRFK